MKILNLRQWRDRRRLLVAALAYMDRQIAKRNAEFTVPWESWQWTRVPPEELDGRIDLDSPPVMRTKP